MAIGIRQRLIILILIGLLAVMGLTGIYRFVSAKRSLVEEARTQGGHSAVLLAGLAAPYLESGDVAGLDALVRRFLDGGVDIQEATVLDGEGRPIVERGRGGEPEGRIAISPAPITSGSLKMGSVRITVLPPGMAARLRTLAVATVVEYGLLFAVLAALLTFSATTAVTAPLRRLSGALKDLIDGQNFALRLRTDRRDEMGELAEGVNELIGRMEQIVEATGAISSRIGELSPAIAGNAAAAGKDADVEAESAASVSSSVTEISSSIQAIAESAESLRATAEETSSAILEMNASNQEVARHTAELASSVDDVTTSVTEMIASIREVADHVDSLSSAADETSASTVEIEATVREVEQAATESARLSQQVSAEAKDIGVRSISGTTGAINSIKEAVERYSGLVTRLGKRSEEIGKILGVIVEVTERTNLLALNASILAAQAGEHGRGFAVVGEEIKALADRTAGSAQDIAALVNAVQKETREAVAAMSDSLSAVDEGVLRSREADAALGKILESSVRSADMSSMIERAMAEQARGIRQVSGAVANVKQMAAQIAGATQAQAQGSEMILHAAEDMRDIARRVNIAVTEQGRGGQQIAVAADNVTVRAASIASGTREQRQAVGQIVSYADRIQDIPRVNRERMDGIAEAIKAIGEQAALLRQGLPVKAARVLPAEAPGGTPSAAPAAPDSEGAGEGL